MKKKKNLPKSGTSNKNKSLPKTVPAPNASKRYPNGRTLNTQDKYLPTDKKGNSTNKKDNRRVAVLGSNRNDELAVVRLTAQNETNTTALPTYKQGNKKTTYFKHFVEIEDNEGKPIKVDGKKFKENPRDYDLNHDEVKQIKNTVYGHVKQSKTNNENIKKLKDRGKK